MANPYPTKLRVCAVRAYEAGTASYREEARQFAVGEATLQRWVRRQRRVVDEQPDLTTDELTRAYNQRAQVVARVHRSSIIRALQRLGYVFNKNGRGRSNSIVPRSRPNGPRSAPGRRP